jgi:hypothetical protein
MGRDPTRREALIQIAAGATASGSLAQAPLAAQEAYRPENLSAAQYKLLTALVDMIIPPSETPGAAGAGVDRLIDEMLARSQQRRKALLTGLQMLEKAGFGGLDETARVKLLTEYSEAGDERGAFFRVLKDMTVEAYYSTEIGLVEELGYQGNAYLKEFPGCRHEEHH